jgi:hypothetical protein
MSQGPRSSQALCGKDDQPDAAPPRLASTGVLSGGHGGIWGAWQTPFSSYERVKRQRELRVAAGPRLSFGDLEDPMCSMGGGLAHAVAACMSAWDRLSRSTYLMAMMNRYHVVRYASLSPATEST